MPDSSLETVFWIVLGLLTVAGLIGALIVDAARLVVVAIVIVVCVSLFNIGEKAGWPLTSYQPYVDAAVSSVQGIIQSPMSSQSTYAKMVPEAAPQPIRWIAIALIFGIPILVGGVHTMRKEE